jgi:hypothetical protein
MFLKEISQQYIREYLSNKYDIVYVAPGCALNPINNNDNNISEFTQQNLKCLGKYQKRLYILIDPELDTINLGSLGKKIFDFSPKLILVEANEHIRVFESEDETLTVLAISDYIDYDKNFDTIKLICNFVLENKIKMIMQDFTGRDLTYYYIKLIKLFGKERMLENIIFDITQMYGGNCFPDVETDVKTDTYGNFIQSKYDKININTVKDYWTMIRNLAYMIRNPRERHYNSIKICVTFIIYDMINFNFEFNIQEITDIFYIIVNEILRTKEIPEMKEELVNGLLSYDEKMRTDIINKFALIMK